MRTRHLIRRLGIDFVGLEGRRNRPRWLISEEIAHTLLAASVERCSYEGGNEA